MSKPRGRGESSNRTGIFGYRKQPEKRDFTEEDKRQRRAYALNLVNDIFNNQRLDQVESTEEISRPREERESSGEKKYRSTMVNQQI